MMVSNRLMNVWVSWAAMTGAASSSTVFALAPSGTIFFKVEIMARRVAVDAILCKDAVARPWIESLTSRSFPLQYVRFRGLHARQSGALDRPLKPWILDAAGSDVPADGR